MDKPREVRPWDLFNSKVPKLTPELAEKRFEICLGCEHLIKITNQCSKCGCFMKQKTKLAEASCPIQKWGAVKPSDEE